MTHTHYKVVNAIINTLRRGDCVAYISDGNGGAGFGLWYPSEENMELREYLLHFKQVDSLDVEDEEKLCDDWEDYDGFDRSLDFYELSEDDTQNPFRIQVMVNPDMYVNSHNLRDMIVDDHDGLDAVEITEGINGYPKSIRGAVVGVSSYEQAEHIANLYGVEVVSLRRRDGWQFYESQGNIYNDYDMMDVYSDEYDVRVYSDAEDFIASEIDSVMDETDEEDFDGDYSEFMVDLQSLKDRIFAENTDGKIFIVPVGNISNYELIPRTESHFHEDIWTYDIALDCLIF